MKSGKGEVGVKSTSDLNFMCSCSAVTELPQCMQD